MTEPASRGPALALPLQWRRDTTHETAGEGRGPRSGAAWWALAVIALVTLVLVMHHVGLSAIAPRTPWDENALFQLARIFAGEDDVPPMLSGGYYPLTSLLIAPIYWFTHDAATVYGWANLLTNATAVLTLVPLALIAKRLGLTTPRAVVAASVTMLMPAFTGLADYVLTEQVLGLFVVLTVHMAIRFWERPGVATGLWTAVAAFAALFTHARAAVLIGVLLIWLIGLLFDKARRRHALWLMPMLIVATLVIMEVAGRLASLVTVGGFSQGTSVLENISDPNPVALLKTAFLETWATNVGTLGIFAFGVVVLGAWAVQELVRERRFGPGVLILGVTLGGSVLSWINWATVTGHFYGDGPRFDSWVYTRYIAPFVMVAILVGISALMRRMSLGLAAGGVAFSALLALPVIFVFADTVPIWGSTYGPGNVAALRAWEDMWPSEPHQIPLTPSLTNGNRFWIIASLLVLGVQVVLVLIQRFRLVLAAVLIAVFGFYALESDPSLKRDFPDNIESAMDRIEAATGRPVEQAGFEMECASGPNARDTALNWSGYWLAPMDIDLYYPSTEEPESPVVIACNDWPLAQATGAREVPGSGNYGYGVWVLPGNLAATLEQAGVFDEA